MKSIIKDFSTAEKRHLDLITEHFPDGFNPDDLISIVDSKGKFIQCLEVRTEDVTYLFKIDEKMMDVLDEHTDDDFNMDEMEDYFDEEY